VELGFTAEQRAWRDEVRALADSYGASEILAVRAEMESLEVERHAPSFYRELCQRGWVGLGWPEPHGRSATHIDRFVLHEELDAAGLPLYGVEISEAIGWMLVRHGPPELAATHLPKIVDGTWTYAGAYSEPEAGSDLLALRTRATRDGDVYRVSGSKLWTSGAHLADWIFAVLRTDPSAAKRHEGLSIVLIDTTSAGVEIRPVPVMGGWRVNACFFDEVEVPVERRVGGEGEGWAILSQALDVERSMSFGGRESRLLLARVIDRLSDGDMGDADLERLGWLVTELEVERLMGLRLATMADRGESATVSASIAKVFGSELAQHVAR
jgi:3-oxocholest-4-en-26-oyl-CoA dehydrogenase alpha subunit